MIHCQIIQCERRVDLRVKYYVPRIEGQQATLIGFPIDQDHAASPIVWYKASDSVEGCFCDGLLSLEGECSMCDLVQGFQSLDSISQSFLVFTVRIVIDQVHWFCLK